MSLRDFFVQVAQTVWFDNSTNGFISTDTQGAIEEAMLLAANSSRGPTICGFDGSGSVGRWLEFFSNNPSNNNPFIIAENNKLVAISISASSSSTGTVTIFKNGTFLTTITLTASKKNAVSGLSLSLAPLDEISLQITSGSISRPTVFMFIQTTL
jgi:hypothetical protein